VTFDRFIAALEGFNAELYVEDLLDALWLAQLDCKLTLHETAARAPGARPDTAEATPIEGEREREHETTRVTEPEQAEGTAASEPAERAPVYARGAGESASSKIKASPVAIPAGHALPRRLHLTRAMRPFSQKWPSRRETELDEQRTVELTADLGIDLYPVFRPVQERWFDVDVVLEDDPAVLVWQDTLREFCQMLRDTGAFRDLRRWRLHLDHQQPILESLPGGGRSSVRVLNGVGTRRLVFFATHGSSVHWNDSVYAGLLDRWRTDSSIVILQMQPRHRWKRSALGEPQGTALAFEPGLPTSALRVEAYWWSLAATEEVGTLVPVPVVPLDPDALSEWAHMQMARGRRCSAVLLDKVPDGAPPTQQSRDASRALKLLLESSPEAYRVAVYLASGPFTLPVARLVQETMFGATADQAHLADVLLSGVVLPRPGQDSEADPNRVYYECSPEARTILLRSLHDADAQQIAESLQTYVSRYIEQIHGRAISFQALVPDANGNYQLPDWAQPFARLGVSLLGLPAHGTGQKQAPQPLNELKLLVVGNEAVGKTSLLQYLITGKPRDPWEPKTPGIIQHERIEIRRWSPHDCHVQLNVWDFGGQEMMRGTHRFFLTERSLYLLVLEDRRQDDRSIYDWIKTIHNRGGASPVIVVINKSDEGKQDLRLDENTLQTTYSNIVAFLRTSCDPGDWASASIERLRLKIVDIITQHENLKYVRDPIPASWLRIKSRVRELADQRAVLPHADFIALCKEDPGDGTEPIIEEDEQRALLRLLHELGAIVAHGLERDAPAARREINLLDPNWLTGAVYHILDKARSVDQEGEFLRHQLVDWLDPSSYPPERHEFILDMMQDRDIGLCFRLPTSQEERYLIPEALPANSRFYGKWPEDSLRFRYVYNYLPPGLIPRFIVQSHKNLTQKSRWRTGAVLEVSGCEVLVVADPDRRHVDLHVTGPLMLRRAALNVVLNDLEAVHQLYPEAEAVAVVPLQDHPEVHVSYEHLLKLEMLRGPTFQYFPDGADRSYAVGELLNGVRRAPSPFEAPAADPDPAARRVVAADPAVPPEVLAELAHDADSAVRRTVATNPAVPPEVLAELAHDADSAVRRAVATNPAVPPEVLAGLVRDADSAVRRAVATNPVVPPEVLAELVREPDAGPEESRIAQVITRNPSGPEYITGTGYMIADRIVQTSNIVVRSDSCEVLLPFRRDRDRSTRRYSGRVAYRSSALNLALVEILTSTNEFMDEVPITFGIVRGLYLSSRECVVLGAQRLSFRDGPVSMRLLGQFQQLASNCNSLEISLHDHSPSDAADMAGLSGSIVFSDRLAIAILQSIRSDGRLVATPIAALLEEPEFQRYWTSRGLPAPMAVSVLNYSTSEPPRPPRTRDPADVILGSLDLVDRRDVLYQMHLAIRARIPVIAVHATPDDMPEIFLEGLSRDRDARNLFDSMVPVDFHVSTDPRDTLTSFIRGIISRLEPDLPQPTRDITRLAGHVRRLLERSGRRNAFYTKLPPGSWPRASEAVRSFVEFWSVASSGDRGTNHPFIMVVLKRSDRDKEPDITRLFRDALDTNKLRILSPFGKINRQDVAEWVRHLDSSLYSNAEVRSLLPRLEMDLLGRDRETWTLKELRDDVLRCLSDQR
jgi:GTPase SAR1 family protein